MIIKLYLVSDIYTIRKKTERQQWNILNSGCNSIIYWEIIFQLSFFQLSKYAYTTKKKKKKKAKSEKKNVSQTNAGKLKSKSKPKLKTIR